MRTPRAAGALHVDSLHLDARGVFLVDFTFKAAPGFTVSDPDVVKSALISVQQNLLVLLHRNGFWRYDDPMLEHRVVSRGEIKFSVGIQTYAGAAKPIIVDTKKLAKDQGHSDV